MFKYRSQKYRFGLHSALFHLPIHPPAGAAAPWQPRCLGHCCRFITTFAMTAYRALKLERNCPPTALLSSQHVVDDIAGRRKTCLTTSIKTLSMPMYVAHLTFLSYMQ